MTRTPTLHRITTFPVKSLPGRTPESARLVAGGALEHDREFAIVDAEYVNGKRTDAVHGLDAGFDPAADEVWFRLREAGETLGADGAPATGERKRFSVPDGRADAEAWLGDYFGFPVGLRRDDDGGYPDTREYAPGPTVISTATLRTVASWFEGLDAAEMRRRLRANLEVGGVPAFWEERLLAGSPDRVVAFEVGGATFEGAKPCSRCVVPTRDAGTGEPTEGFRERFVAKREETMPEWTPTDRLDGRYSLMIHTTAPPATAGAEVRMGDPVRVGEERPARSAE